MRRWIMIRRRLALLICVTSHQPSQVRLHKRQQMLFAWRLVPGMRRYSKAGGKHSA